MEPERNLLSHADFVRQVSTMKWVMILAAAVLGVAVGVFI